MFQTCLQPSMNAGKARSGEPYHSAGLFSGPLHTHKHTALGLSLSLSPRSVLVQSISSNVLHFHFELPDCVYPHLKTVIKVISHSNSRSQATIIILTPLSKNNYPV